MQSEDLVDLHAFMVVAELRSFTRAAAKLGTSQSALSRTLRRLEERIGVRLLTRTTRSVAPTQAGENLLAALRPALQSIGAQLASLGELRVRPAGFIRITTPEHAARTLLWPVLEKLLPDYPEVSVELNIDPTLTDIVLEKFDAGVRLGEALEKDMVAVRIGPDLRMVVVGAPSYFESMPVPTHPRQLVQHRCISRRLATDGTLYAWEFRKATRALRVRVDGQLVFNQAEMMVQAAVAGFGLAYVMEDRVQKLVASGRLVTVLDDWCPAFAGYHLYFTSRRQPSAAFALLVGALRHGS